MSGPTRVPSSSGVSRPAANTRPLMQPRLDTSTESFGIRFSCSCAGIAAAIHAANSTTFVIVGPSSRSVRHRVE